MLAGSKAHGLRDVAETKLSIHRIGRRQGTFISCRLHYTGVLLASTR